MYYVEEARMTLLIAVEAIFSKKILLGMTCYLGWAPCSHKAARDAPPIPLAQLLQPY